MTHLTQPPVFHDQNSLITDLVIPCVDVAGGRTQTPAGIPGLHDPSDAVAVAAKYADDGANKLFIDVIDPWERVSDHLPPLLRRLKGTGLCLIVSVGHGVIPSVDDAGFLLEAGADVISASTSVIESPEVVKEAISRYGGGRFNIVINSRPREAGRWTVYTHNGSRKTPVDSVELARELGHLGVGTLLPNAVDREGVGQGYDLALTRTVAEASGLPVIASGGCGTLEHLTQALGKGGATYVLVNSMVHSGKYSIAGIRDALYAASPFR
ncbi:HisA/HisF-related TIM barrel protein [Streptomyces achromogenes]|uniref:HisA/HisF-related TIM barrel protein n=1 Tax=Streptomyces achromogenes TaxID=67255 RepID=UPI0036C9F918